MWTVYRWILSNCTMFPFIDEPGELLRKYKFAERIKRDFVKIDWCHLIESIGCVFDGQLHGIWTGYTAGLWMLIQSTRRWNRILRIGILSGWQHERIALCQVIARVVRQHERVIRIIETVAWIMCINHESAFNWYYYDYYCLHWHDHA